MIRIGHGLKLFSLCALALGLMAFSAAAAQAEVWMVKGKNLESSTENKALVGKLTAGGAKLLATLGLNKVTFACTAAELLNGVLEPAGLISDAKKNGKVDFSGCTTEINGKVATACEPIDGTSKGVILTEEGLAFLALHKLSNGTKHTILIIIVYNVNKVFAAIHMGKACSIGESVEVFGELALWDVPPGLASEEKLTHTVEEFKPLTILIVANSESKATATLDGSAEFHLESDEIWNGLKTL